MDQNNNSRLYKRIEFKSKLSATLVVVESGNAQGTASACMVQVKDFSKSGMGVFSKVLVPKQCMVRVSIEGLECEPLEGRVVWSGEDKNAPAGLKFRIGIDFMPRDDAARENQLETYRQVAQIAEQLSPSDSD